MSNQLMASFLQSNPEQLQGICHVYNDQQKGHKAIAEALTQQPYLLHALTPTDLITQVQEHGAEAFIHLFSGLNDQHREILGRVGILQTDLTAILTHEKVQAVLPEVMADLQGVDEVVSSDGEEE